ncbi:hypothetical protein CEP52_015030 [Fusarium oligoseptatum]|uniref:Uncharacterized protein n=1 Tax=Fusarium oligoseptatum TaxID=2604345 RepID=A0A428SGS5_9HYPO|nr:hypothetical protein CEP52_015030 [Fusarium oligoseptatum]
MAVGRLQHQKRQANEDDLGGEESETTSFITPTVWLKGNIVGYWSTSGTAGTFACPSGSTFWPGVTIPGDDLTYARCAESGQGAATTCKNNAVQYTDVGQDSGGGYDCNGTCTTFRIFDYYNWGDWMGVQYMIDCDTILGSLTNRSITAFYRQIHSTTTEASATTHGSTTTSTSSATGDPENNTGTTGLSSGAIAGIVIGAIAGLCLIGCGFYIAYRMGRQSRDDPEKPRRTLMDSLRAIPRPNVSVTWTQPKGNAQVPVLQQTFSGDVVKRPGEMLGDTSQHDQQLAVAGVQSLPKPEAPVVELPGGRVTEAEARGDDGVVGARTDQQQPYAVHRANSRPSGI